MVAAGFHGEAFSTGRTDRAFPYPSVLAWFSRVYSSAVRWSRVRRALSVTRLSSGAGAGAAASGTHGVLPSPSPLVGGCRAAAVGTLRHFLELSQLRLDPFSGSLETQGSG